MQSDTLDVNPLVQRREHTYFVMLVVVQLLIVAALLALTMGIGLLYLAGFLLFAGVAHGLLVGYLRGSAVHIGPEQFPDLHERITRLGANLGLERIPDAYILQGNGLLNAFATHFFGRRYVVLFSDIVEPAYEQGSEVVDFVIAHELAHHRRAHVTKSLVLWPATLTPFLSKAWSRACEYTCDRIALAAVPQAGARGLALLASGKRLYPKLDTKSYARQAQDLGGFWLWISEVFSTHPHLSRRIHALELAPTSHGIGSGTAGAEPQVG